MFFEDDVIAMPDAHIGLPIQSLYYDLKYDPCVIGQIETGGPSSQDSSSARGQCTLLHTSARAAVATRGTFVWKGLTHARGSAVYRS